MATVHWLNLSPLNCLLYSISVTLGKIDTPRGLQCCTCLAPFPRTMKNKKCIRKIYSAQYCVIHVSFSVEKIKKDLQNHPDVQLSAEITNQMKIDEYIAKNQINKLFEITTEKISGLIIFV